MCRCKMRQDDKDCESEASYNVMQCQGSKLVSDESRDFSTKSYYDIREVEDSSSKLVKLQDFYTKFFNYF